MGQVMTMADDGARILVVDDAPEFVELLVPLLESEGYQVVAADDGESAIEVATTFNPDVVVLDLGLPRIDGVEVCRRLRTFSHAYVIMLTSRTTEVDRVVGLEVGADDYMTKPFSPRELVARVRAMLRRPRQVVPSHAHAGVAVRQLGDLRIDTDGRTVQVGDDEIPLTRIEFDLLDVLTSKPTMVFSRAVLRDLVWGADWFGDDHVIDVHIANLRKKIDRGTQASRVRTVRGVGYRMESSDRSS